MNVCGLDTETIGFSNEIFAISAWKSVRDNRCWFGDIDPVNRRVVWTREAINNILDYIRGTVVCWHNGESYDRPRLERIEVGVYGVADRVVDTLACAHVCNSQERHNAEALAHKYCGIREDDVKRLDVAINEARRIIRSCQTSVEKMEKTDKVSDLGYGWHKINQLSEIKLDDKPSKGEMWLLPVVGMLDEVKTYAIRDSQRAAVLAAGNAEFAGYLRIMDHHKWWPHYDHLMDLIEPFAAMEQRGIRVLKEEAHALVERFERRADELTFEWRQKYGSSIRSPEQCGNVLFGDLGFKPVKLGAKREDGTRKASTDKEVIAVLKRQVESTCEFCNDSDGDECVGCGGEKKRNRRAEAVALLSEFRDNDTARKYINGPRGYMRRVDGDGIVRARFNPFGTGTGRRSSSDPNFQNIAVRKRDYNLRQAFGPREGYVWIAADYSNLELRIFAWMAQEDTMLQWFADGRDCHQWTGNMIIQTVMGQFTTIREKSENIRLEHYKQHPDLLIYYGDSPIAGDGSELTSTFFRAQYDRLLSDIERLEELHDSELARTVGKTQNFRIIYGGGADKGARVWATDAAVFLPDPTLPDRVYNTTFPGVHRFKIETDHQLVDNHGRVFNAYGRPLVPPHDRPYAAVDYRIQGTAAQITGLALIRLHEALQDRSIHPIIEKHDEIVVECERQQLTPELVDEIRDIMEDNRLEGLVTPVNIEIHKKNWAEHVPYNQWLEANQ